MAAINRNKIVSIIIPAYNCQNFIGETLESILSQSLEYSHNDFLNVEICIYEDGSTDATRKIIAEKCRSLHEANSKNFWIKICLNESGTSRGAGYGRNRAIEESSGDFLCFCDGDDIMMPNRLVTQYKLAIENLDAIIGSKYRRYPEDSTLTYTKWANFLTPLQLYTQIFLTFGPTLIISTWFCHRSVYDNVNGGFDESGITIAEDLTFFNKHLRGGGKLVRSDDVLMIYRYHPSATTFAISQNTIRNIRIGELQSQVLSKWSKFTIWNAGKQGRRFFRSLSKENQGKVSSLCDVDLKKINQNIYHPYPLEVKIPIVHVTDAQPPFIICVKTELTWDAEGPFRKLLESLNIQEGVDYYYFN